MRLRTLAIFSALISFIAIYVAGLSIEEDTNAAIMYLVVFASPAVVIVVLNTLLLSQLRKSNSSILKVLGGTTPIVSLVIFSLIPKIHVVPFDGDLRFVSKIMSAIVGFTNLLWIVGQLKNGRELRKEYN